MTWLVSDVITPLRVRLGEATARQWADVGQLVNYVSDADFWLVDLIGKLPGSGKFIYTQTFTLPASSETYNLSSLTKKFAEMREIGMSFPNGVYAPLDTMQDSDEFMWRGPQNWTPGGLVRPVYRLLDEAIQFLPIAAADRTMRITYRWRATPKTAVNDSMESPQEEIAALITRALHFALADARETNTAFEQEHAVLVGEIEARWQGRQYGSNTERVKQRASHALFPF